MPTLTRYTLLRWRVREFLLMPAEQLWRGLAWLIPAAVGLVTAAMVLLWWWREL